MITLYFSVSTFSGPTYSDSTNSIVNLFIFPAENAAHSVTMKNNQNKTLTTPETCGKNGPKSIKTNWETFSDLLQ